MTTEADADPFPLNLGYRSLAGLPFPVQVVLAGPMLPIEVAVTGVRILRHTEALLGEIVLLLRGLRPVVVQASQAYVDGQFDPVLKTLDQIAHGTSSIAVFVSPLNAFRDAVVPRKPATVEVTPVPDPDPVAWVRARAATLPGAALLFGSGAVVPEPVAHPQEATGPTTLLGRLASRIL